MGSVFRGSCRSVRCGWIASGGSRIEDPWKCGFCVAHQDDTGSCARGQDISLARESGNSQEIEVDEIALAPPECGAAGMVAPGLFGGTLSALSGGESGGAAQRATHSRKGK